MVFRVGVQVVSITFRMYIVIPSIRPLPLQEYQTTNCTGCGVERREHMVHADVNFTFRRFRKIAKRDY